MTRLWCSPPCVCIILTFVKAAVSSTVMLAQWFSSSHRRPGRSRILHFEAVIQDFVVKFSSCRCHRAISFPLQMKAAPGGENLGVIKFKEPVIRGGVRLSGASDAVREVVACRPLLSASVAKSQRGRLSGRIDRAQPILVGGSALPTIPAGTQSPGWSAWLAWSPGPSPQLTRGMRGNWGGRVSWTKTVTHPPGAGVLTGCPTMVSSGLQPHSPLSCSSIFIMTTGRASGDLRPVPLTVAVIAVASSAHREVECSRLPACLSVLLFMNGNLISPVTSKGDLSVRPHFGGLLPNSFTNKSLKLPSISMSFFL